MAQIYQKEGLSLYDDGGKTYNAKTGQVHTPTPVAPIPTTPTVKPPSEITTLSSANFAENTKPKMDSRMTNLENRGTYTDMGGMQRYSDGTLVEAPMGASSSGENAWSFDSKNYGTGPTYVTGDDEESKQQNALLQSMKANLDASTKRTIDAIQSQMAVRKAQQADINKRQEAGTEQSLLMGGSSRHAQQSSQGIMSTAESFGVSQLADLDAQEQALIANAKAAQESGDYKIMEKALSAAETKRKEKQEAATKLSETIAAENAKVRTQMIASSRDSAVAGLIGQGVTDPAQLLDYLNYDESGKQVGDFTADEISKTLKALTIEGKSEADFKTDLGTFTYLQKNNMLPAGITNLDPSQQYFAYLNMQKLANSGKLSVAGQNYGGGTAPTSGSGTYVGKGAGNETEEQILRMRLFAKLSTILNKGALSDTDRSVINGNIASLRAAGLSEQEIMSQLAGFPSDVKTPYNSKFIDLVAANTDTNEQQQTMMGKVGQLLASGSYEGALNTVEGVAMKNAKEQVGSDNFVDLADVKYVKQKTDEIEKLLGTGWNNEVGAFTGSFSSWLSKKFGWGQAAQIRSKITSLTADLTNKRGGSAITESEWKRLVEPNIPQMNDSAKTFVNKLNELVSDPLTRLNSERSLVSLPELTVDSILDPEARLKLYASESDSSGDDFWGSGSSSEGGGGMTVYDPNQGYVLPTTK